MKPSLNIWHDVIVENSQCLSRARLKNASRDSIRSHCINGSVSVNVAGFDIGLRRRTTKNDYKI